MHKDDSKEHAELSGEIMDLDNVSLEDLEARLELALGHMPGPSFGCTCDCPHLTVCSLYCGS